ncbi:MAG: alpha/beta fold hydrolase, partial [Saccharofermentanales bacterium]
MSRLKKAMLIIAGIFLILNVLPYLIPVTRAQALDRMPFTDSRSASVAGIRLHYRIVEPAVSSEEPKTEGAILFVHGFGGSTFSWRSNAQYFADRGYFVVSVDLPGFGFSDRSRGIVHSQEQRAQLLWTLLDRIGESDPFILNDAKWILAGHSMGGGTVTAMAAQKPERTACLIYADAAVLTENSKKNILFDYPPVQRWTEVIARHFFFKEGRISKLLESAYGR